MISNWNYLATYFETRKGVYREKLHYCDDKWGIRKLSKGIKQVVYNKSVNCVNLTRKEIQLGDVDYLYYYDNKAVSDVILEIDERRLYAHGFILKSRSPHFIQVINNHGVLQDSGTRLVKISGYSADVYFMFVKCLYTNWLESATALDHLELVAIGSEYSHTEVVTLARKRLMEQLSVDNSSILYQKAQQLNLSDIQEEMIVKMSEMFYEIITSPGYKTIDPEIASSMTHRMVLYRTKEEDSEDDCLMIDDVLTPGIPAWLDLE